MPRALRGLPRGLEVLVEAEDARERRERVRLAARVRAAHHDQRLLAHRLHVHRREQTPREVGRAPQHGEEPRVVPLLLRRPHRHRETHLRPRVQPVNYARGYVYLFLRKSLSLSLSQRGHSVERLRPAERDAREQAVGLGL